MARDRTPHVLAWLLPCCLMFAGAAAAAELEARTALAYDRYAEEATQDFLHQGGTDLQDEVIRVAPGRQDGIVELPGGLVHHWKGRVYIRGITLVAALDLSRSYEDYPRIYRPVIASSVVGHQGNVYRVHLRIKDSAGGLSAVLDVTSRVQYFFSGAGTVYSISTSEDIREIEHPGTARERQLPAGRDSGYLWRASTLNRLTERDDGVLVEMETLGLSRTFPRLLGWIIEPIARRLGRRSVELSLQQFRDALLARNPQSTTTRPPSPEH